MASVGWAGPATRVRLRGKAKALAQHFHRLGAASRMGEERTPSASNRGTDSGRPTGARASLGAGAGRRWRAGA